MNDRYQVLYKQQSSAYQYLIEKLGLDLGAEDSSQLQVAVYDDSQLVLDKG